MVVTLVGSGMLVEAMTQLLETLLLNVLVEVALQETLSYANSQIYCECFVKSRF
jgi:hypothetical protein